MKRWLSKGILTVTLIMCSATTGFAAPKMPRLVPGNVAQQRVSYLTSQISWHQSLPEAQALARQQNKMIFWVQMLGQIDGAT